MQGSTTGIVSNLSDLITKSSAWESGLSLKQLELESSIRLTRAQWLELYKHLSTTRRYQRAGHVLVKYRSYNIQGKRGTEIRDILTRNFGTGVTSNNYLLKTKVSAISNTRYKSANYPIQMSLSIEVNAKSIDVPTTQQPDAIRSSVRWNFRTQEWFMSLMIVEPDVTPSSSGRQGPRTPTKSKRSERFYMLEIEKIFSGPVTATKIPKLQRRYDVNPLVERNMAIARQIVNSLLSVSEFMYTVAIDSNLIYTRSEAQAIHNHLILTLPPPDSRTRVVSTIPRYIYNKAINLSPRNLSEDFMVKGDYRLTIKADGERKIMMLLDGGVYFVSPPDRINKISKWNNSVKIPINGCVLDGELLEPSSMLTAKPERWTFMVIDCLRDEDGNDIRSETKAFRMERARRLVDRIRQFNISGLDIILKQFTPFLDTDSFYQVFENLVVKDMIAREMMQGEVFDQEIASLGLDPVGLEALLKRIRFETKLSYKSDGIILEPFNVDYYRKANKNMLSIFKWKPPEVLTVDLFYSSAENKVYASESGANVMEFTGTTRYPFDGTITFPQNWKKSPIDIVMEFRLLETNIGLHYYRDRPDKDIANNINVARDVWNDMNNPLTMLDVTGRTTKVMRSYHNSIKRKLLDRAVGSYGVRAVGSYGVRAVDEARSSGFSEGKGSRGRILLDIGSGKGADISKWQKSGYDIVYAMDPDPNNFRELTQRLANRRKTMTAKEKLKTTIIPINEPVQNKAALKAKMKVGKDKKIRKINTIALFNSTTYFWKDKQTFDSLISIITDPELVDVKNLKILVLSLDGDAVVQLMWPRLRQFIKGGDANYWNSVFTLDVNDWQTGEIQMSIEGTLVQQQSEWLPVLGNLTTALAKHGVQLEFKRRADKERFLSHDTTVLSSLYSYAVYTSGNVPKPQRVTGALVLRRPPVDETIKAMLIESSRPFSDVDITKMTEGQLGKVVVPSSISVRVPRLKPDQKTPILANVRVVPKTHPSMVLVRATIREVIPVQERMGQPEAEYDDLLHMIGRYKCRRSVDEEFTDPLFVYRSGCIQSNFSLLHCILKATSNSYRSSRSYLHRRCLASRLYSDLIVNGLDDKSELVSRSFNTASLKSLTDLCNLNIVVIQCWTDNSCKVIYMEVPTGARLDRFTVVVNYSGTGYELVGTRSTDDMSRILDFETLFVNDDGLIMTLAAL